MAGRAKVDLSNEAKRAALPLRTSFYSQALGSSRYILLRRQARGDIWAARWPGVNSKPIGPVADIGYEDACALVHQMAKGAVETAAEDVTFGDVLDEYELWATKTKSHSSINTIVGHIRRCEPLRLHKIASTPAKALNSWALSLLTETSGKATANKTIGTLKAAVARSDIDGPVQKLRKFKEDKAEQAVVMNASQVRTLLNTAKDMDHELWRLLRLLWLTGARPSEITDATHNALKGGRLTLSGKTGTRHITLRPAVAEAVRDTIEGTVGHLVEIEGRPANISQFRYRWDKAVSACGDDVPAGATLYALRHSFITQSLYASVPVFPLAAHCGTSVEMISRTYGHVLAELQAESFAALDGVLCNE